MLLCACPVSDSAVGPAVTKTAQDPLLSPDRLTVGRAGTGEPEGCGSSEEGLTQPECPGGLPGGRNI